MRSGVRAGNLHFLKRALFPCYSDSCAGLGTIARIGSRGGAEMESPRPLRVERTGHRRVRQLF